MRLVYWLLVVHGIVCLLGAFFPFYPPIVLFYWFFPGHFAIKLIIVLLVGAFQVVYGGYLLLKRRWHVRWYWLALSVFVFAGLLLIFPALHPLGLFTGLFGETPTEPPYPSVRPGPERPDDIIPTPGGPQYRANVHQEGVENPWPPIETKEEFLDENVICIYRAYIETKAGEARNNIIRVVTPGRDIRSLNLYASNIPNGIEVKRGMEWHGPHSIAQVLIMEISQDVQPGQYTLEIGVEIDGKNYGKVPCIIKVTPETTPTPVPPSVSFFPIQLDKYAKEAYPSALATGILALDNGRLRLKPITGIGDSNLLIWPPDFSVHIQDNTIHILNKDGNTVARVGDKIKAGGGQVPAEIVEKYIGQPLPDNCPGPYWLVSEVVTDE